MKDIKILIVEDECIISMELIMRLQPEGYKFIYTTGNGELDGIEAAGRIQSRCKNAIIYLTANSHLRGEQRLINTHPFSVLNKPVADYELVIKTFFIRISKHN